jgi:biopolymer transport protein ExbD
MELPKERNQVTQTKPENIVIAINKDGDVFWGMEYMKDSRALFDKLKKVAVQVPQPEVHIRADEGSALRIGGARRGHVPARFDPEDRFHHPASAANARGRLIDERKEQGSQAMAMSVGSGSGGDPEVMVDINTTPLIDVMLVLLIMLIITIPIQTHAVKLNMPVGNPPPPPTPPEVVQIDVDFDGRSFGAGSRSISRPWTTASAPRQRSRSSRKCT